MLAGLLGTFEGFSDSLALIVLDFLNSRNAKLADANLNEFGSVNSKGVTGFLNQIHDIVCNTVCFRG